MRGAPHMGFSRLMWRIVFRTSSATFGHRAPCWRDRHVQNRRSPVRCQETTVSGLTRNSASNQLVQIRRTTTREQAIAAIQLEARLLALVHGKLLSKSDRLHWRLPGLG